MNLPKLVTTVLIASALSAGLAEATPAGTTYDIASYTAPPGYKVDETTRLMRKLSTVSYTHLTLPTNREV